MLSCEILWREIFTYAGNILFLFFWRGTSFRAIFARDIILYYSYVQSYEALAQKIGRASCRERV